MFKYRGGKFMKAEMTDKHGDDLILKCEGKIVITFSVCVYCTNSTFVFHI